MPNGRRARIESPTPDAKNSIEPLAEARQQLAASPYVDHRRVHVSCEDGAVRLHGRVSSYYLKQLAQELVRRAVGVQEVINQLHVEPPLPASAEQEP